jgi:type II secretory pathway component PulF
MDLKQKFKYYTSKIEFNWKAQCYFLEITAELISYNLSMQAIFSQLLPEIYPKGGLNFIVKDIEAALGAGINLSDALKKWLNPQLIAMIKVGETTGRLAEGLKVAVNILKTSGGGFLATFLKGISYGMVVSLASLGILILFATRVMPAVLPFLQGKELPPVITAYVSYYTFILDYGVLCLIIFIIAVILLAVTLNFYTGSLRTKLDKLPIFKIYRQIASQQLLEELSQYFKGNVLIDTAIDIIHNNTGSRYLKSHCERVVAKLSEGVDNIAFALDTGLFDSHIITVLIAMGKVNKFEEKSGAYAEMIKKDLVDRLQKSAGYMHMLLMGTGALNIGWSMFAMYSSTSLIGG